MGKYLVAYVSKTGTTREIAERIASDLERRGPVDLRPLSEVKDPERYDGLILGSPINGMKLLPELHVFLERNREKSLKVLGIFAVSYIFKHGRRFWKRAIEKDLGRAVTKVGSPRAAVFGGRIPSRMPGFANLLFGLPKDLPLDLRDWDQIRAWTISLPVAHS